MAREMMAPRGIPRGLRRHAARKGIARDANTPEGAFTKKAMAGNLGPTYTGTSSPYEAPEEPDIHLQNRGWKKAKRWPGKVVDRLKPGFQFR